MSGGVWYFDISWYYQTVMIISKYQKDYQEPQAVWFRFINKARKWKTDTKLINTSFVEQNIYCFLKKNFQMQYGVVKQSHWWWILKMIIKWLFKPFESP